MNNHRRSKLVLAIGLTLAIVFDTVGQLLWKFTVTSLPHTYALWPTAEAILRQPLFVVLAGIFICQLINWLTVLEHADLSFAQPITSLSFVTVCVLSAYFLGEHIGLVKAVGVLCVLSGVWLVSQGKPLERANPGTPE